MKRSGETQKRSVDGGVRGTGDPAPDAFLRVPSISLDSPLILGSISAAPPLINVDAAPAAQSKPLRAAERVEKPASDAPFADAGARELKALGESAAIQGIRSGRAIDANLNVLFHGAARNPGENPEPVPAADIPAAGNPSLAAAGSSTEGSPKGGAEVPPPAKRGWLSAKLSAVRADFAEFTPSQRAYIQGYAWYLFAFSAYLSSLPLLIEGITGSTAMTGTARAVTLWTLAGSSLLAGPVAKRFGMVPLQVFTSLSRGIIFGTIGWLSLLGKLSPTMFLFMVALNAALVAAGAVVDIKSDGARQVFEKEKIKKAVNYYELISAGMMLAVPPVTGVVMDAFDAFLSPGSGVKLLFATFAMIPLWTAFLFATRVKLLPGQKTESGGGTLLQGAFGVFKSAHGIVGMILVVSGAAAYLLVGGFAGLCLGLALLAGGMISALHWPTLLWMYQNKAVRSRAVLTTGENFVEDALFMVVLPSFAIEILKTGATGNGLMITFMTLGQFVASLLMVRYSKQEEERLDTYPFVKRLSIAAALAFLPSIGFWLYPSLWLALPLVALMKFLYQPIRTRMGTLLQEELAKDPTHAKSVFGLIKFLEMVAAGMGGLLFSWIFQMSGPGSIAPMKVVTLALLGISALYLLGLLWLKSTLPSRKSKPAQG